MSILSRWLRASSSTAGMVRCKERIETDLTPYRAGHPPDATSVLALAPHPDDEVFGCGGALALHADAGTPVRVILATDGARFGDAAERARESEAAAHALGIPAPQHWSEPDRGLNCDMVRVERLMCALRESAADVVYAPSPWEVHPDHRQLAAIAWNAALAVRAGVRIAFYEVGAPLSVNYLVDISAVWERKRAAMHCFQSQFVHQDYDAHIEALNRYRTYTLARSVTHAEAFWVVTPTDLKTSAFESTLNRDPINFD